MKDSWKFYENSQNFTTRWFHGRVRKFLRIRYSNVLDKLDILVRIDTSLILEFLEDLGDRSHSKFEGDFATGLIFSLNIHEEEPGDIASRPPRRCLFSRLRRACSVHATNERCFLNFIRDPPAKKRHVISSEKRPSAPSLFLFAVNFERMTMIPLTGTKNQPCISVIVEINIHNEWNIKFFSFLSKHIRYTWNNVKYKI